MPISVDDVIERLRKTRAVQESIAETWVWKKRTLAQWEASIVALQAVQEELADAVTLEEGSRGARDAVAEQLHEQTKRCVGVAKVEFAENPAIRAALAPLTAPRTSWEARARAAQALAAAWEQHFPDWEPTPGDSLESYNALRAAFQEAQSALERAIATRRERSVRLTTLAREQEKEAKAWYAVATRLFPVGTPEGTLIRADLP